MGRFTATYSYLTNHFDEEYQEYENPDETTLFSLIRAFDKAKASHIHLYYFDTPDVTKHEVLMIAACNRQRFVVSYRNTWVYSTRLQLQDPAQRKNYQEVPYRLDNGELSFEYMRYTVALDKASEVAAYFLKHGTINQEESWKTFSKYG